MPIASITKNVSRPAFMFTNIQSELFQLGSVMAIHIVSALIKCRGDPAKTPRVGKRPHHDFCLTDMNT